MSSILPPVSSIPIPFTLRFSNDLPNGPYSNASATGHFEVFVPPSLPYSQVNKVCLKAWFDWKGSLGSIVGCPTRPNKYRPVTVSEGNWISEIRFKGGAVVLEAPCVEGDHHAIFTFAHVKHQSVDSAVEPVCCAIQ